MWRALSNAEEFGKWFGLDLRGKTMEVGGTLAGWYVGRYLRRNGLQVPRSSGAFSRSFPFAVRDDQAKRRAGVPLVSWEVLRSHDATGDPPMHRIVPGIASLEQHFQTLTMNPEAFRPARCGQCGRGGLWSHGFYERKADRSTGELNPIPEPRF